MKLSEYLERSAKLCYGLTKLQTRKLAYDYAISIEKIPEGWHTNNVASKDWLRGFLSRNSKLFLRTPEATSLSRATTFNRTNVGELFKNLKSVFERYKIGSEAICNIDEIGLTTVQRTQKVIATKGVKQVSQATSAERSVLVTLCCAVNAIGNSILFFVFSRVKFKSFMLYNAPVGSGGTAYSLGWMTGKNFFALFGPFC